MENRKATDGHNDKVSLVNKKSDPDWRDASYKLLFTFPEMVSDFLRGFVPHELIGNFDDSSLREESANHVNRVLLEKREDKIWRVTTDNGQRFYIYLLFEFQSTSDKMMALRAGEYSILFIRDLYRKGIVSPDEEHPPVLPIVIYNGKGSWTAKMSCSELCRKTNTLLDAYQPEQRYFLVDVIRIIKESLRDENNLSAMLFRMEQCKTIEEFICEIQKAKVRLSGDHYEEFRLLLSDWIRFTVMTHYEDAIAKDDTITLDLDLEEVETVLGETLDNLKKHYKEEGIKEGKAEGLKEGKEEGIKEGIKEGKEEERKQNIQKLYSNGFSIQQICNGLGLEKELVASCIKV